MLLAAALCCASIAAGAGTGPCAKVTCVVGKTCILNSVTELPQCVLVVDPPSVSTTAPQDDTETATPPTLVPGANPCAKVACDGNDARCVVQGVGFECVDTRTWCAHVAERTVAERRDCCAQFGYGCATMLFDCTDDAVGLWSVDKRRFCCLATAEGKGCAVPCDKLPTGQVDYCCDVRGNCGEAYFAAEKVRDGNDRSYVEQRRYQAKVPYTTLADQILAMSSPKAFLRQVRLRMLGASALLRTNPRMLLMERIGVLEAGGGLPPRVRLPDVSVVTPATWNSARVDEEVTLVAAGTLEGGAQNGLQGSAQVSVFVEYTVEDLTGSSATLDVVEAQLNSLVTAVTRLEPQVVPTEPASKGGSKAWLVIGAVFAVLCGALVVAAIVHQNKECRSRNPGCVACYEDFADASELSQERCAVVQMLPRPSADGLPQDLLEFSADSPASSPEVRPVPGVVVSKFTAVCE